MALPPAERARAQTLADQIAAAGTAFDKGIADGRKTVQADPAELDGLPADYIAAHPAGPDGKITISTDYPDLIPVMTYARSEPLRRRLYEANMTRAWPQNDEHLRDILNLRQELATLLGRKDHATLVLEDKMLDTPAKVEGLMAEMAAAARPAAARDFARKLAVFQLDHPGATTFQPWDNGYLTNLVQKRDFAYDRQDARQYFAYDNVRDGILRLTEDLFGVTIRPWQTAKWDPLVETYEVREATGPRAGQVIGRFYFDSHPRPGKYNHANMINLRPGLRGRTVPVGALVMNLPAGSHATGLMEHNDVETFLHEFGHMLHHIFGGQTTRWAGQSGVSTEWDFVEAPSQMLEEWAPAPADLGARTRELDSQYAVLALPAFAQFQDGFGHLNGYSAVYYTYRWSKVIADDMFTAFAKAGLRDKPTALAYRTKVLQPGGTKPAAALVQDFLGRPISLDAYKAEAAKDQ